MISETTAKITAAGSCAGCAALLKKFQMLDLVIWLLIIVILVDLFFIWRRCNDQKRKISALRVKLKGKETVKNGI